MPKLLTGVSHSDHLSLIDHLDELRSRLFVCVAALIVAFSFCFWQNSALLSILNAPLEHAGTPSGLSAGSLSGASAAGARLGDELAAAAKAAVGLATNSATPQGQRDGFVKLAAALGKASADLPRVAPPRQPITTGVGEPFTATLTVSAYFALLLSLPIILWQAYAFILPAFNDRERKVVLPLMMMVPVLFTGGVLFGYLLVIPPAVSFLQNFNSGSFDILVQAKEYYAFVATLLLVLGLIFQVPVGLLALNRAGIVSSKFLTANWRIIVVVIAVIAALLPGVDPVTTMLEMLPLLVLYGLSILLLKLAERGDGESATGGGWALESVDEPDELLPYESKQENLNQVTAPEAFTIDDEDLSD